VPLGTVPHATFAADLTSGYLTDPARGLQLQGVHVPLRLTQQHLTNPTKAPWVLDSLTATLNTHPVVVRGRTSGFTQPDTFLLHVETALPLDVVRRIAPIRGVDSLGGWINLDAAFDGRIGQLQRDSLLTLQGNGALAFENAHAWLTKRQQRVDGLYASLLFDDTGATIEHLSGRVGRSDVRVAGTLFNIMPFLYDGKAGVNANLRISSDTLFLNELLLGAQEPDSATARQWALPERSNVELQFRVSHLAWDKFKADSVLLDAALNERILTLRQADFQFAGGHVNAFGGLNATDTSRIRLRLDADAQNLDFQQAFRTFNNFNQKLLTADNARGRLFFHLNYQDTLPSTLVPDFHRTQARVDLELRDGVLYHFAPLGQLTFFFRDELLDTVPFAIVAPDLRWLDQQLNIHDLRLYTSILDMVIEGTHTLDSRLDYRLQVAAIRNRNRVLRSRLEELIYGDPNRSPIALHVTGPANAPRILWDTRRGLRYLARKIFN
jgi:AsmA-like C-terminal region